MAIMCRACSYEVSNARAVIMILADLVFGSVNKSVLPDIMNARGIKCPECGEVGRWDWL